MITLFAFHSAHCILHTIQYTGQNCSVLQLSKFRHRGGDPISTLSETFSRRCFLPTACYTLCAGKTGRNPRCVLQISWLQYQVEWFTVHWIHLPRDWLLFNCITSVGLWSAKKTDTHLSESHTSTNPQIHKFHTSTNPQIHKPTNPRIHESTVLLGCTTHSTLYAAHCIVHSAPWGGQKLALCTAAVSVRCFAGWPTFHSADR